MAMKISPSTLPFSHKAWRVVFSSRRDPPCPSPQKVTELLPETELPTVALPLSDQSLLVSLEANSSQPIFCYLLPSLAPFLCLFYILTHILLWGPTLHASESFRMLEASVLSINYILSCCCFELGLGCRDQADQTTILSPL